MFPKLQLIWLLSNPHDWTQDSIRFSELRSYLRPLFRRPLQTGPSLRFVAIGDHDRSGWPLIFELCECRTISGDIKTTLGYVTHRELFDHNPDLTLLDPTTFQLPDGG